MAALQLPRQRLATLLQALGGSLWHAAESLAEDGMLLMGKRDKRTKKGKVRSAAAATPIHLAGRHALMLRGRAAPQIFKGIGGKVCRTTEAIAVATNKA